LGATALASAGGLGYWRDCAAADEPPAARLKLAAARKGIQYGANSDVDLSAAPPAYARLFADQCTLLAPLLSWAAVSPSPGVYDFRIARGNLDFAAAHALKLTGAHLLWHKSLPRWLDRITSSPAVEKAAMDHVSAMASRFAGRIYCWNVVNEAIYPEDGQADGLRADRLLKEIGPSYFDLAFRAARAADPSALLAYNDFNLEQDRPDHAARRQAVLALVDRLHRAGTPIDAVGLQSHLQIADFRFNEQVYRRFLRDLADRGVKIILSELDVLDIGAPSDIARRDRAVAEVYARFVPVALDEAAVAAVITWGLSDRYTWLTPQFDRRFARADGLPTRPLPFDADFRPKRSFYALLSAFEHAPPRRA